MVADLTAVVLAFRPLQRRSRPSCFLVYQESRGLVNAAGASSPLFTNLLGSGVPKTYPFEVHAEEAGSLVDVLYAVTQSTT